LLLPFENGTLATPEASAPWLFVNAEPAAGWERRALAVQDHRGLYNALERAGYSVSPAIPGGAAPGALILISRTRRQTEGWVAAAAARVMPGGRIVIAGEKQLGIASLRKRIGGIVTVEGSLAKHHATVFWFAVPRDQNALSALAAANVGPRAGEYETADGLFSRDQVDEGSRLLAAHLPAALSGEIADFGAGWGYLAVELCRKAPEIAGIALFDASHAALEAARRNMARLAPHVQAEFHWQDLTAEPVARRYDAILMNPPFHIGHAAEPSLGQAFIVAASRALKPGGRLFMVANRQLPYEAALKAGFRSFRILAEDKRYKIVEAVS
jgi:16S rRNA (guanine1207-N2)-methyltransferase